MQASNVIHSPVWLASSPSTDAPAQAGGHMAERSRELFPATPAVLPPAAYWNPEPYTNGSSSTLGYYYSPNARQVFATESEALEAVGLRE